MPEAMAHDLATTFGTTVSSFPQTYLGLPLSPIKVSVSDCLPLISSVDKHLSGWSASLLNRAGRLVLSTAMLSSIPLHYMMTMSLPKTVPLIDDAMLSFGLVKTPVMVPNAWSLGTLYVLASLMVD
jgi:hypothetical protein